MIITKKILQTSLLPIILLSQIVVADPIHDAVIGGNVSNVKRIIEHSRKWYAIKIDIDQTDSFGESPLALAARFGYADIAQYLIDQGADINRKNVNGRTPLHIAATWDKINVVEVLIKNDANINVGDINGLTPIYFALYYGVSFKIIQLLKDYGSDKLECDIREAIEMEDLSGKY